MSNNARTEQINTAGAAIAEHLHGWTWHTPGDMRSGRLVHDETGAFLYVSQVGYGDKVERLEVSSGVPEGASYGDGDYPHDVKRPEVTVSAERDPATVARDLARRLVPAALDYYAAVRENMARRLAAAAARETLAQELAGLMGSSGWDYPGKGWQAPTPHAFPGYGQMTPDYRAESVQVELSSVPLDMARDIARMIAAHVARGAS